MSYLASTARGSWSSKSICSDDIGASIDLPQIRAFVGKRERFLQLFGQISNAFVPAHLLPQNL